MNDGQGSGHSSSSLPIELVLATLYFYTNSCWVLLALRFCSEIGSLKGGLEFLAGGVHPVIALELVGGRRRDEVAAALVHPPKAELDLASTPYISRMRTTYPRYHSDETSAEAC